ncbi:hypothetical protein GCM10023339_29900 [Alloalcanivorax gelatiniphagus]
MLSGALLASLIGLALLDSLNPVTVAGVALILMAPITRPLASALAFVAGAFAVVLAVGVGVFLGLDTVGEAVSGASMWVRRIALLVAAAALLVSGWRRLRARHRDAVVLPGWFSPWTAAPVGVLGTAADLPNAFPYLITIERLTAADVTAGTGIALLAGYALIYCLPCLVLLVVGTIWHERISARLAAVYERFGAAREVPRSVPVACALAATGLVVAGVAMSLG